MVGVTMNGEAPSEGLFLKTYLGTVSAVPRPRTAAQPTYGDYQNYKIGQPMQNGIINHARMYEPGEFDARKQQRNGHFDDIQVDNEEKKKERKWTLGGFFRKKSKKDADDSSEESGEKGFLNKRKSKRSGRKPKANGFDVVIPQHKEPAKNGEEQLWRGEAKPTEGPVRFIHRHPETPKQNNSLQVPKHTRRDSNLSRSSGENTEGRKGRKEVMARAEAKRDMIRDDSSSDEYESYHSNSSLNRINGEGRRPRRTDKHKRQQREEEPDLRITKSDFETSRRPPPNYRFTPRTYHPDSSDHEPGRLNLMNHSGTPSPCRSPRARQKQLLHYMMMQNAHPTSTFPPGIHQQIRNGAPGLSPTRAKENLPFLRNQAYRINRNSEYNLPRSLSSENSNRRTLMDYEQLLNSCGTAREKSLSFDQNIHRASCFDVQTRRANLIEACGRTPDIYNHQKTYNGFVENRSDSTPSLQSGIFPQPTQIVQRSASGISFPECSRNPHVNRYQHVPPETKDIPSHGTSVLRYYADQNPRSRNPIHITCNPTTPEQPYLSDSQVVVRPVQTGRNSASDFWKLRDQELMKQQQQQQQKSLLKPPTTQTRSDRSRSSSPRAKKPPETVQTPPEPPIRRLSKQEVLARLQKCEQLKNRENEMRKVQSSNLDEALNELEMIYNSLRLKDEDLVDRAERRDLPVYRPKNPITPVSVRDKIQNFYAEADYPKSADAAPNGHQRAIPLRRSGVPDKTTDDMAFRRMNQKDRTEVKKLPQQSYLRSSPALSPVPSPTFRRESPVLEPDVTYDDVVFRNIRHANSTLRIQDPQPPFGIPVGVIAPAPNSDYLHATPTDRFRPTFTSSKTPDVVKDDLAFRNLRKDNRTNEPKNEMKKRAVRSLSANLYNIMQKDNPTFVPPETNDEKNCQKTRSLTDLSKGKQAVEKRLKELKEEKNAKRAEFFEVSRKDITWTDLVDFEKEDLTKRFRSPVVELSKYPAAAPSSTLQGNPFKEPSLDDDQLENLLSALAKEAENASKDLERQLDRLETKTQSEKVEEFNRKFKSADGTKRRRNLSLSNANESREEVRKTGSLERRKKNVEEESIRGRTGQKISKSESASSVGSRNRSQSFEMVTDLSQILRDVEVQQHLNNEISQKETNTVFQEVYEYNCKLPSPERRGEEAPEAPPATAAAPEAPSDVETEFERLHEEATDRALDELLADVAGGPPAGPRPSFPFPNDDGAPGRRERSGRGEGLRQQQRDRKGPTPPPTLTSP